jgi:Methyltransferase domain
MGSTSLDLTVYRWIESQTSQEDRLALLSIQEVLCASLGSYTYLEVGSHLGGSLQPHVCNERCKEIFSIDPRPLEQPDERWATAYRYEGNSTRRMFDHLGLIPDANLGKVKTFEACSWQLQPADIPGCVDYAFIDGEHTNTAVLRDFEAVRRFLSPHAIVAFHDSLIVPVAIRKIRARLREDRSQAAFLYFPHSQVVCVVFDAGSGLVPRLIDFGWQQNVPVSRWAGAKRRMKESCVCALLRKCKRLWRKT